MLTPANATPNRPAASLACRRLGTWLLVSAAVAACGDDNGTDVQDPSENPCTGSVEIAMGQSTNGTLTASDCTHQPSGAYGDRWSLTLSASTDVRIDLASTAFDAYLELRTGSGTIIAENDDAGSLNSRIIQTLQAGSYIIVARSLFAGETGPYSLSVTLGPDCSTVGNLSLGVTEVGVLETSDCLNDFGGFMDNWTLNMPSPQKLRIDLKSADFDEIVLLRDQQGQIINGADWGGPTGYARLETQVAAGDWTISATSYDESQLGSYELTVDLAPPCTPGTEVVFGQSIAGELSAADCLFDGFAAADSFALTVPQETPVSIQLKSADFPPLLFLRNPSGMDVEVGFDFDGDGNAWINRVLQAGTYALFAASGGGPQQQGSYTLTVSEIVCPAPSPITYGQAVSGTLDGGDCLRSTGAFQESWELVLANAAETRIDLISDDFDTYLVLKDDLGNDIEANDDGGSGTNSRIDRSLPAGTYEIAVSSFGTGQVGDYQLTVGAPAPAGSPATPTADETVTHKMPPDGGTVTDVLTRMRAEQATQREVLRRLVRPK